MSFSLPVFCALCEAFALLLFWLLDSHHHRLRRILSAEGLALCWLFLALLHFPLGFYPSYFCLSYFPSYPAASWLGGRVDGLQSPDVLLSWTSCCSTSSVLLLITLCLPHPPILAPTSLLAIQLFIRITRGFRQTQ